MGLVATGYAGLAYLPASRVDKVKGKEWQHLIQKEVRADVEEIRASRMVGTKGGRMFYNVRSPGPTSGKQTSIISGS